MTDPKNLDVARANAMQEAADLLLKQARREQKSVRQLSTAPNGAAIEKDVFERVIEPGSAVIGKDVFERVIEGARLNTDDEFPTTFMAHAWDIAIAKDESPSQ